LHRKRFFGAICSYFYLDWLKISEILPKFAPVHSDYGMGDDNNSIHWVIVDVEVSLRDRRIHDIGALRYDGAVYHGCSKEDFSVFMHDADYICGHNIIHHDAKYLFPDSTTSISENS
jgi:hypothetical protein